MYACGRGDNEVVKLLLSKSADINTIEKEGQTPLMYAAWKGHNEVVKLLLSKGADINTTDTTSKTALMYACGMGHNEVVNLLLSNGADINTTDTTSNTALMYALRMDHIEVVKLLISKGADINTRHKKRQTPHSGVADKKTESTPKPQTPSESDSGAPIQRAKNKKHKKHGEEPNLQERFSLLETRAKSLLENDQGAFSPEDDGKESKEFLNLIDNIRFSLAEHTEEISALLSQLNNLESKIVFFEARRNVLDLQAQAIEKLSGFGIADRTIIDKMFNYSHNLDKLNSTIIELKLDLAIRYDRRQERAKEGNFLIEEINQRISKLTETKIKKDAKILVEFKKEKEDFEKAVTQKIDLRSNVSALNEINITLTRMCSTLDKNTTKSLEKEIKEAARQAAVSKQMEEEQAKQAQKKAEKTQFKETWKSYVSLREKPDDSKEVSAATAAPVDQDPKQTLLLQVLGNLLSMYAKIPCVHQLLLEKTDVGGASSSSSSSSLNGAWSSLFAQRNSNINPTLKGSLDFIADASKLAILVQVCVVLQLLHLHADKGMHKALDAVQRIVNLRNCIMHTAVMFDAQLRPAMVVEINQIMSELTKNQNNWRMSGRKFSDAEYRTGITLIPDHPLNRLQEIHEHVYNKIITQAPQDQDLTFEGLDTLHDAIKLLTCLLVEYIKTEDLAGAIRELKGPGPKFLNSLWTQRNKFAHSLNPELAGPSFFSESSSSSSAEPSRIKSLTQDPSDDLIASLNFQTSLSLKGLKTILTEASNWQIIFKNIQGEDTDLSNAPRRF